jgi:hypothetical protein
VLADLDRMLTLSDDVLRHRVIRLPEGNFTRREIRAPRESTPVPESVAAPEPTSAPDVAVESEPAVAEIDAAPAATV